MSALTVTTMTPAEQDRLAGADPEAGLGALRTERGNLPLELLDMRADLDGLAGALRLTQGFTNPYDEPLEATYIFPLPDRFAVTGMRMTAAGRTVEAELRERGAARAEYEQAVAGGKRAAIAEEERPDVFTMRVGNILPGERVSVELSLAGPLSYQDGEATFRFPLVVAPRYIPGTPLPGTPVGDGYAPDTGDVPDASRITPPVLLPGFPNPVRLSIVVTVNPGSMPLEQARCSLPTVPGEDGTIRVAPGQRVDRDFVLRLRYGQVGQSVPALALSPDVNGAEGTFQLTVVPPTGEVLPRPRDVVLLLDRSGSMSGWKMVAARRAAARIIDTLTAADRFAVFTFDSVVEHPRDLPARLVPATDRHRYRAVEHLARAEARGGTEMLRAMREGLMVLTEVAGAARQPDPAGAAESAGPAGAADLARAAESADSAGAFQSRDRVLVLVTDGQVGNEDQILRETAPLVEYVRVHTVGIDQAVNAGFLGRLATFGGGRCELVESEDRLDEAMGNIHRRIGAPLATGLTVRADGLDLVPDTTSPARLPDLFPGVPLILTGRYRSTRPGAALLVEGRDRDGRPWQARADSSIVDSEATRSAWARAHLRDLEDRYATRYFDQDLGELERRIVETSLRFGVLCRFTAFVAVDTRVVTEGGEPHRVVQPVEAPAGWDMLSPPAMAAPSAPMTLAAMSGPLGMVGGAAPAGAPGSVPGGAPGGLTFGRRRSARAAGAPQAAPAPPPFVARGPVPAPSDLRDLVTLELRRLRAAEAASTYERRQFLDDLATRLTALIGTGGGGDTESELVRHLVDAIRAGQDSLDELWGQAVSVLETLSGAPGTKRKPGDSFWKR